MKESKRKNKYNIVNKYYNSFSVHVRIAESPHEGVRAHHLLHPDPNTELSVAIPKLVHIDADHTCVVVKFDKTLNININQIHCP